MSSVEAETLFHNTGWFHTEKPKAELSVSDDLSSMDGVINLRDGALVVERIDLGSKMAELKTLLFVTDTPLLGKVQAYLQRFQGFRAEKKEEGDWTLIEHHIVAKYVEIQKISPEDLPCIMDLLAAQKNLSQQEILIVDDSLVKALNQIDWTVSSFSLYGENSPQFIFELADFFKKRDFSQVQCIALHPNITHIGKKTLKGIEACSQNLKSLISFAGPASVLIKILPQISKTIRNLHIFIDESFTEDLIFERIPVLESLFINFFGHAKILFSDTFQPKLRSFSFLGQNNGGIFPRLLSVLDNSALVFLKYSILQGYLRAGGSIPGNSARVLVECWPTAGQTYPHLKFLDLHTALECDGESLAALQDKTLEYFEVPNHYRLSPFEQDSLALKARTLVLEGPHLEEYIDLTHEVETLILRFAYTSVPIGALKRFLAYSQAKTISLKLSYVEESTLQDLRWLMNEFSKFKFSYENVATLTSTHSQKTSAFFQHQPLNFDASDQSALSGVQIFEDRSGIVVDPSLHLQNFHTLVAEDFSVLPLAFEGVPIDIPSSNTKPRASDEYQGRLICHLQAKEIFALPTLPNAEILAMALPKQCALYRDSRTGQYGIESQINQSCIIEWKIRAQLPKVSLKSLYRHLFEGLKLKSLRGEIQVYPLVAWPDGVSDLEKMESLAAWISGFDSQDGKAPGENLSLLTHLNRLLREKKGRCSERTFLFNILARYLIPECQTYYVSNSLHVMPVIVEPRSGTLLCFNLGGTSVDLDIRPRVQTQPIEAEEAHPKKALLFQEAECAYPLSPAELLLFTQFQRHLSVPQKIFSLDPRSWEWNTTEKPKNLCLVLNAAQERDAAIEVLKAQDGVFMAPSLEALRSHLYVQEGDKYAYQPSPFAYFLASEGHPKTLVISGKFLIGASGGPSKYYPLLDATRMIKQLTLDKEIQIVVLMLEEEIRSFREDFRSRFQAVGRVASEGLNPGVTESKPSAEDKLPIIPAFSFESKTDIPILDFRVNAYNFDQLFPHPVISPTGLKLMPAYLNSQTPPLPKLYIIGELSHRQWQRLSEIQDQFAELHVHTSAWESHLLLQTAEAAALPSEEKSESRVHIQSLPRAAISSHIPEDAIALALPEIGNPLVRNSSSDESGFIAQFTALKTLLETPGQTLVLYGKLSPALEVEFLNMSSGTFTLAGEKIVLGEGTRIQVLSLDKFSTSSPSLLEIPSRNPFCQVCEGPVDLSLLEPLEVRLDHWRSGRSSVLTLSSFDLVNPRTRSLCRDLVNSAFAGQVMIEGKLIDLRRSGKTVEVLGLGIPSKIRKMAEAFGAYQSIDSHSVLPIIFEPSTMSVDSEAADILSRTGIIPTSSRLQLVQALNTWLDSKDSQHPLFLVEGPSGIGKSVVLKAYLSAIHGERLQILLPSEDLIQKIETANQAGKIVLIDEINTLRPDQLEAITVLMQSHPHLRLIGTQNPISFQGRAKLSTALMDHAAQYYLEEYSRGELLSMCQCKGISAHLAEVMVSAFLDSLKQHRSTFRDFIAGITEIEKALKEEFDKAPSV